MLHGRACFPPAITPAAGRPARCTVTLPGDTGSVGDVAPHRQQASSRIWRVATSPTRVLQAPITQRCTRSVPLHPIRRSAPDQKGCNAYGSGAPPPTTSTNASIPFRHTQPTASDAATRPRHAHPGSEREALHQLASITPPPSWCNTPLRGVTPARNKQQCGYALQHASQYARQAAQRRLRRRFTTEKHAPTTRPPTAALITCLGRAPTEPDAFACISFDCAGTAMPPADS